MTTPPPPPLHRPPPPPPEPHVPGWHGTAAECDQYGDPPPLPDNFPPDLEPLPAPRDWTGGRIGREYIEELINEEGYPAPYVIQWVADIARYLDCLADSGGGGGGGGDGTDLPPPSEGDPAGDPGPIPRDLDYADWDDEGDKEGAP